MAEIVRLEKLDDLAATQIDGLLKQMDSQKNISRASAGKMLGNPTTELWVVKDSGKIVGMTTINYMHRLTSTVGYVDDVIIDREYRGQGLGKQLIQRVVQAAKEKGATRVALTSRANREVANAMYQKLGFQKKDTNVYRLEL